MRLFYPILLSFFLVGFFACKTKEKEAAPIDTKPKCHLQLGPDQLTEDFAILITSLRELHPDLYRVNSKEFIDAKISAIQNELQDSLSYLEFLKLTAPLLTDIGCINTQWGHSAKYIKYRNENTPLFPIDFRIEEGKFILERHYSSNLSLRVGDEITEINGVSVADYLQKNYPLLPIDGKIKSLQNQWLSSFFPNHHSNFWEQVDTFHLKIVNSKKEIVSEKVAAKLKKDMNRQAPNEAPLSLEIIDSIAVLKIASFNSNIIERHNQDFVSFVHSSFQTIKEKGLKLLVLDLSGNSWGDMQNGAFLYSYLTSDKFQYVSKINSNLKKQLSHPSLLTDFGQLDSATKSSLTSYRQPNTLHYDDQLYLITDGWNINAGGYFCSKIQNRPKTVFTGEKAGSTTFGMNGIQKILILPHSELSFYIPTIQFVANENEMENIDGKEVDLAINPPYVEHILQYIQQ